MHAAVAVPDRLIHDLFTEQAARTPDAAAIELDGQAVSYRDLDESINRLAHALQRRGVGPDAVVGLYLERSIALFTALCAVLKAGGAYLPLDPDYPAERLAFMLDDARPIVVLTQASLRGALPAGHGGVVLCLDADELALAAEPTGDPPRGALGAEHLAYVIYTSGSTGKPKGVAMTHGPLRNLIAWQIVTPEIAYRTLQFASPSFDVCCQEVFSTWASGGTLVLISPDARRDPRRLLRHLTEQRVERAFLPPVALYQLADAAAGAGATALPRHLREIIAAGEALRISPRVSAFFGRLPGAVLRNQYGPSETHVVTELLLDGPPESWPALPSIGRPIRGVHCHVLDEQRRPVPRGDVGEIYMGGAQVARGYLGRPELTAERFLPDPFVDDGAGGRMYRTGDLARWTEDGDLEFCGRADTQVKLRGYRVELGEIESVLEQHPGVKQAVVALREDTPGDRRLAAYLVADGTSAGELRRYLKAKLPDYMVPAAFVLVEQIPLLPSGKVDRRALPAPDRSRPDTAPDFLAPRTPDEEVLAGIWAEVLGIDRIGALDNFFELGGHSLLGASLLSRLRTAFGVELSMRALFEAPTVALLAERVVAVRESGAAPAAPPLVASPRDVDRDLDLPLSLAQMGLWLQDQLAPDLATYNIARAVFLAGPLDEGALERSLAEIVRRHEALRTTFVASGGEPRQVISAEPSFTLPVVDLQALPGAAREPEARRLATEEASRPFDLARGPLFRATLLRLEERSHVLLTTTHHIVSDGWSESVLLNELSTLYEAFSAGRPSPLAALPIQVADHARWQREWLSREVLSAQIAYWREQLRSAPTALDLPLDRPRPLSRSQRGAICSFLVPDELAAGLAALARREGVTLFMVLLAAYQVLLQRYSGQDDIVVGSPIAGRTHTETEGLIGLFVNTLVLRCSLAGEPTFTELLARVREVTLGAYAHQDAPLTMLVEELATARDLGRSPLFQTVLVLENAPPSTLSLGAASGRRFDVGNGTSKVDLLLAIEETRDGLAGALEYATDLFDEATIARMASHFVTLLAAVVEDPWKRLHEIPLLSAEEREALATWNDTATVYPRDASLQTVFEAQVEQTPDAVAVSLGPVALTYRELNRRANQLARYLQRSGVGAETPVGLCLHRSLETVVAILAVLKAGGAYVPLDPGLPRARCAWVLDDARVATVVTLGPLPEGTSPAITAVRLDLLADALAGEEDSNLATTARGDSLAYLMYTSGSTGTPKGVSVLHRGVIRLVKQTSYARFAADEVFLQLAPTAFDASTFEIWGALLNGGRLALLPIERPTLTEISDVIQREQVTTLWLTAGLFNTIIEELPRALAGLRQLLVGGEALSVPHVEKALRELPGVTLINGYGPTEGTTFTCCFTIAEANGRSSIPIGRPIANTVVHVLDRHLALVPVGVVGELYAGGDGLARGYLNRPELTAERFIADPFSADPAARLYRTGDLVRRLPSGDLEFRGRVDEQVKIRGYRIEPGEIEAALGSHPSMRACVVMAREDTPGDRQLCAYVVLDAAGAPVSALRDHLAAALPDYLIPAAFVVIDALPLGPNGKVDRGALPAPDGGSTRERAYLAPRTPTEEVLAGIFAEVLRLPRVSVDDDFFTAGGHSLLGTRVMARLSAAFGVDLPLRALFEALTVARLAERVEAARKAGGRPPAPPITPAPRDAPLPLSFAQQRLWFLDQLEPNSAAYNMPGATRLIGPLDVPALARSLEEIVRRHEALRTTLVAIEGHPRQIIAAPPSLRLPVLDLEALPASAQEIEERRRIAIEVQTPFNLATGPLIRASLLRRSATDHLLLLTMPHIVGDGWSLGVLWSELRALYPAFQEERPSPLAALRIQYADHAVWQRQWLSGEVLSRQLAYWTRQLVGAPSVLDLPTDRPRPAHQTYLGAIRRVRLSQELGDALEAASRREGVTLFMILLATLQTLLHLYSGQDDILVGSPIAGRTRAETEELIGFFANTLVLRTDLSEDPTFRELLGRVREVTLGAYEHQDLPFEKLVEELRVERDLGHNPLFQVMLVLQNTPPSEVALAGLTLAEEPVEMTTTRFDLLVDVARVDGGLRVDLTYSTDLFNAATIEGMLADLDTLLRRFAADPGQRISAARAWTSRRLLDLAVVATFTAEPIEDSLALWTRELGITSRIRFAPYGQVFQQLLDPGSLLGRNGDGANVVLVRFEDWMSGEREDPETSVDDLVLALTGAAQRCPAPHVVVVCPPSPAVLARSEQVERFQRLTRALASRLSGVSGVHVVSSAEIAAVYPVADLHDPHSDRVGHVPYTPLYFAALGTAVVRRLSAILGAPYKVIVLDCDQTLWKGIVGEAAEGGVTVDAPRRALQEWMVAQHERGMLLCLCSKNNEADVLEVFERGPDMPLRREHILAHRINWRPKSENLISLAAELGLGLDSFVFVDDDPLECAEVKARCPDVLTLELPRDPAQIPQVLRHVWAFDHLGTSHEDRQRTVLYRQNAQRERLRGEVPTLQAFVAGLDLRVSMSAMTSEHLERVSQLTQRTNQLNFTTRRRTESDLQQRLSSGELDGLVVEVRDRFGDYGLVGCVLFSATAGALRVDTFLLSCRALGRGVEVQMLARLGGIARERGLLRLEIEYRRSKKNRPALELLERTCGAFQSPIEGEGEGEGGHRFEVPARDAQALDATAYLSRPEIVSPSPSPAPLLVPAEQGRRAFVVPDHVATSLDQAEKVLAKIRSRRRAPTGARMDYVPPRTRAEEALVAIWADMLGVVRVGLDDDFFALGGHSLLAVRVFDRIGKHFGKHLPIATLFQAPTIRQLAGLLTRESWMPSWSSLVPICTTGSRRPFFCVHSLGGNVLNFRLLSRGLGQDQPFYGLQSRGLGGDEAPQESVEQMATAYIEEMRAVQPEGPYAIGGSSSGGVIAYEMAQQLVASGQQVAALVMLDTRWIAAPSARLTRLLTTSPVHPFGVLVDIHLGNLLLRRPRAGLAYLVEKVRGTLGLRPTVETVEPDPFIPQRGLESAIRAITSYVPRPYPGQAAMLLSSDDPGRVIYDRRLAWADLVQGGLTVRFMPGSHDNMLDEPQVDGVAAVVAQCLVGI